MTTRSASLLIIRETLYCSNTRKARNFNAAASASTPVKGMRLSLQKATIGHRRSTTRARTQSYCKTNIISSCSSSSLHSRRIRFNKPQQHLATTKKLFSTSSTQEAVRGRDEKNNSIFTYWKEQVSKGNLHYDIAQEQAVEQLQHLQQALLGYSNEVFFVLEDRDQHTFSDDNRDNNNNTKHSTNKNEENEIQKQKQKTTILIQPPADNGSRSLSPVVVPRGLYIFGSVGTGKSLLMDSFFRIVHVPKKKRYHFHDFMSNMHKRIHQLKQQQKQQNKELNTSAITATTTNTKENQVRYTFSDLFNFTTTTTTRTTTVDATATASLSQTQHSHESKNNDPIVKRVAYQIAQETTLLCLDEFQVTDVADSIFLLQLFQTLFSLGTIVVFTSNRPPQHLYEGGMNRKYFLIPFLEILHKHCNVHNLQSSSGRDYRKVLSEESSSLPSLSSLDTKKNDKNKGIKSIVDSLPKETKFFFQEDAELLTVSPSLSDKNKTIPSSTISRMDQILSHLLYQVYEDPYNDDDGYSLLPVHQRLQSFDIDVGFGRTHRVKSGDRNGYIGRFHFNDLCDNDLGPIDYQAIAKYFSIIVLDSIPDLITDLNHHHNRCRRFITLLDDLYEAKCALLYSTQNPIHSSDDLFISCILSSPLKEKEVQSADTINARTSSTFTTTVQPILSRGGYIEDIQTQGGQPINTLASVKELPFAFKRASSRMTEMTSRRWWKQVLHKDGWESTGSSYNVTKL